MEDESKLVPPFVNAKVVDVSIDSEKTVLIFDNGVVLEIEGNWTCQL